MASIEAAELAALLDGRAVLITGAGGFLGNEICAQLLSGGVVVRGIARGRYPALESLGVEMSTGDVADSAAIDRAAAGCAVVIHAAAKVGAAGPFSEFHRVNVLGTRNVVRACQTHGVRALVHTSTPSVVFSGGDILGADESLPRATRHHSAYTATKAVSEAEALAAHQPAGLAVCALRPHLVWGPGDHQILPRLVARRKSGRLRRVGSGENLVDVTYIGDGARAHIRAAIAMLKAPDVAGGRPYFISQGRPVKLWWMIDQMLAAAGLPPVDRSISPNAAYVAGAILEAVWKIVRLSGEPPMTRWVAQELATSHWFNIAAARERLGFEPVVEIEQGLEELRNWCARQ